MITYKSYESRIITNQLLLAANKVIVMTFILYFVVFQQITAHISEYKQKIVTNKNQPENKMFGKSILLNRNGVMFRPFSCTFMYLMLFMYFFHEVFVNSHALIGNNRNKSYFKRKKLYSKRLFKKCNKNYFKRTTCIQKYQIDGWQKRLHYQI